MPASKPFFTVTQVFLYPQGKSLSSSLRTLLVWKLNIVRCVVCLQLSTFQLVLTADETHHFITFNYEKLHDRGTVNYYVERRRNIIIHCPLSRTCRPQSVYKN